jgi:hypothetical protein
LLPAGQSAVVIIAEDSTGAIGVSFCNVNAWWWSECDRNAIIYSWTFDLRESIFWSLFPDLFLRELWSLALGTTRNSCVTLHGVSNNSSQSDLIKNLCYKT